jgi:hypothetical protein
MSSASSLALAVVIAALALPALSVAATGRGVAPYQKLSLNDQFFSEGATFGDLNKDGHLDAISGPYWWAGPDFKTRHQYAPAVPWDPLRYSDSFFAFTHDFNGDGWNDIFIIGFPGVDGSWYLNPGDKDGHWRRYVVFFPVDNESPTFGRLLGDDKAPVLICMSRGRIGYATWDPKNPGTPWVFHPISPQGPWARFTHGLGWGDVNGDGRHDILEKDGWWEQPESLKGDPEWKQHKFAFSGVGPTARGGAQMYVYDVNNDGRNDVIASINAHTFGLSWYENVRAPDGGITFKEHPITSRKEEEKLGGIQFGQPHAIDLADFDGDGLLDILTGKRWWAHGPTGDVQPNAAPVLYAFLLRREAGGIRFEPHLINDNTGVGTQVVAADVNRDGRPDIIVGNKRGTAVLLSVQPAAKK